MHLKLWRKSQVQYFRVNQTPKVAEGDQWKCVIMVVILWPFIDRQFHGDHHTEHIWIFVKKTMNRAILEVQGAHKHEGCQEEEGGEGGGTRKLKAQPSPHLKKAG